uniref:Terpene synthase N-terminal domain-containing protein n=1 Tax=Arundo donax TaxID=35708 RepID=A0A0A8YDY2_ARUDO
MDENGDFKDILRSNVDALLSLYEAAHLGKCDEELLSRAIVFTTDSMSSLENGGQVRKPVHQKVKHALSSPMQRRMKRLEAKFYISMYENDVESNKVILELAKLDFHILQQMHREEVKSMSL